MYSLFLCIFALHVSGAICTHPQEHKLQRTTIGIRVGNHYTYLWLFAAVCAAEDGCK
jgi:hypothetical protein